MTDEEKRSTSRLTDEEMLILKEMIKSEQNMRWLWSTARNTSLWIVGVITAITLGYTTLVDALKHMVGK
ncbi:hypothetical protein N8314_00705 [Akkermansiaceae bacterium]|nr:hypothetical protein [Akkermansiaceae bacterium]